METLLSRSGVIRPQNVKRKLYYSCSINHTTRKGKRIRKSSLGKRKRSRSLIITGSSNSTTTTTTSSIGRGIKDQETKITNATKPERKINVLPTNHQWWQNRIAEGDVYKNDTNPRGPILIINNKTSRPGSAIDVENLAELFRQIGYHETFEADFSVKNNFLQDMESFRKCVKDQNSDSLVVIVMSHGNPKDKLCTTIGEELHERRIYNEFDTVNLPSFKDKPKFFIFVSCRGNKTQFDMRMNADKLAPSSYPDRKTSISDIFTFFSTVPGYVYHRSRKKESDLIDVLTTVFEKNARHSDVINLCQKINNELEARKLKQLCSVECHGYKKEFYLNPVGSKDQRDLGSSSTSQRPPPLPDNPGSDSDSSSSDSKNGDISNRDDNSESDITPIGSRKDNDPGKQKSYSSMEGMAFFFNYILGCNRDVHDLKAKLSYLGWRCKDMKVKNMKDLQKEFQNLKGDFCKTIMVFFFGYGYEDQLFLGSSIEESLSYEVFCQELNKFREEGDAIILFTNTCFKKPEKNTYEYVEINEEVRSVFHFCTEVNGTCQEGSLMTYFLRNTMEDSSSDFVELARNLSMKINDHENWKGDKYYSYWRCYGVVSSMPVPFLKQQQQQQQHTKTVKTPFTENDIVKTRLDCFHQYVSTKTLLYVFKQGYKSRNQQESLYDYYLRMGVKPKSVKKFERDLNKKQKDLVNSHPDGEGFDIALLYKCLRFWCHGLADEHDDSRWNDSGDTFLEALITQVKDKRNYLAHPTASLTQHDLENEAQDLQELLKKILEKCEILYDIRNSDIKQEIDEIVKMIKSYKDDILDPDFTEQYYHKEIISEAVNTIGREKIKGIYLSNSEDTILPLNHVPDFGPLPVKEVYIEIEMTLDSPQSSRNQLIKYENILTGTQPDSVIVINGHAGSGKTTLMKMMISDWVEKNYEMHHLNEYDLVLKSDCRSRHIDSFKSLVRHLMPETYKQFSPEDMEDTVLSQKIIVILDGLDELNSTSAQLFEQLLEHKKGKKFPLIITTRPEKMKYLKDRLSKDNFQVKCIRIVGVPPEKVDDFVKKYWKAIPKGPNAPDVQYLLSYLKKTTHKLADLWRLPYNLILLIILYIFRKENIASILTASGLYKEIITLYTEKLEERLELNDATLILDELERKRIIRHFLYILAQESLIAIRDNNISLSEDAFQRLDDLCRGHKVRTEEMMGAYLQRTKGERVIYKYPHKGLQDFLGAYFIWMELTHQSENYGYGKALESFLKWAQQQDIPPGLIDEVSKCIKGSHQSSLLADSTRNLHTSDSYLEDSSIVRKIFEKYSISTASDMSKYQNLLKLALGFTFFENNKVEYEVKEELVYLLEKAGVSCNHDWIAVLNDVQVDKDVVSIISKRQQLLTGHVEIDDSSLMAYIALLQAMKNPINSKGNISTFHREESEDTVANHHLTLQELEVNQSNCKQIAKHFNESTGSMVNPESVKINLQEKILAKNMEEVLELCSRSDKTEIRMEWVFKHPHQTEQAIKEAIDSTLQRCHSKVENYWGLMTDGVVHLIKQCTSISVGVTSMDDLFKISTALRSGRHSLQLLNISIPAEAMFNNTDVTIASVKSVGKPFYVQLYFIGIREDNTTAVGSIARQLMPTLPREGFESLYFPDIRCSPEHVVKNLQDVRLINGLCFPSESRPKKDQEEIKLQQAAKAKTGCRIRWGGGFCGTGDIDSW